MRQINKDYGDTLKFNHWARSVKLNMWGNFSDPNSTFHPIYLRVREYIWNKEQSGLSAYTEKPVSEALHIDHFRKKSMFPTLMFDYSNFFVDEYNDNYGACYKDKSAGVTVETYNGPVRIFDPAIENMSLFIEYTLDGKMIPKQGVGYAIGARVRETIRVFNLNHKAIRDIRRDIIRDVITYKKQGFSDDDVKSWMSYVGFPSAVNYALGMPL